MRNASINPSFPRERGTLPCSGLIQFASEGHVVVQRLERGELVLRSGELGDGGGKGEDDGGEEGGRAGGDEGSSEGGGAERGGG